MYGTSSDKYDRTRLQNFFQNTTILALAWFFTGNTSYASRGAGLVRAFLLDPATRMYPALKYAQIVVKNNKSCSSTSGVIETKDFYYVLDAFRLLQEARAFTEADIAGLHAWFTSFLAWLRTSRCGKGEHETSNNHFTYYTLQLAAIAAYVGDLDVLVNTTRHLQARLPTHFDPGGEQPHEAKRTLGLHYICFNLQVEVFYVDDVQLLRSCCWPGGTRRWRAEGCGQGRSLSAASLCVWMAFHRRISVTK